MLFDFHFFTFGCFSDLAAYGGPVVLWIYGMNMVFDKNWVFRYPIISVFLNMFNRKKKNRPAYRITISGIQIDVVKKDIKNLNLRVKPSGQVRISCPVHTRDETVRQFANSKMSWIKKHLFNFQKKRKGMK